MDKTIDKVNLIIEGIQDRKGKKITHVDLTEIPSSAAPHFIICEGTSSMHVSSIADNIRESLLEKAAIKPYNYDGYRNAQWIVIDYGDVFVHVFLPETRHLYDLEELWSDAKISEIPDLD